MNKSNDVKGGRLPFRLKVGYGVGGLGNSLAYNLFYMFFIYFLASVAGISTGAAGTISLVAVLWDAISDPLVGYISDKFKPRKWGKRVPFLIAFAIPLGIMVALLFTDVPFGSTAKAIYFTLINMGFFTFFTLCDIPYISLGSELTEDMNERIRLRTYSQFFNNIGSLIIASGLIIAVDFIVSHDYSESVAWRICGIALGAICTISYMATGLLLRGKEKYKTMDTEGHITHGFWSSLKEMIEMKQYRIIITQSFLYNFASGVAASAYMFFLIYTCGFNSGEIAFVNFWPCVVFIIATAPMGELATRIGKKNTLHIACVLMILGCALPMFAPTVWGVLIGNISLYIGNAGFWILIYAMNYDIIEIDDYMHNKRREGVLIAANSFIIKVGVAVGMWFCGYAMEWINVDASAPEGINTEFAKPLAFVALGIPIIIYILMMIINAFYKVNNKNYDALLEAIELRNAGKEHSDEEFKELL